jgi:hypothetical protein
MQVLTRVIYICNFILLIEGYSIRKRTIFYSPLVVETASLLELVTNRYHVNHWIDIYVNLAWCCAINSFKARCGIDVDVTY